MKALRVMCVVAVVVGIGGFFNYLHQCDMEEQESVRRRAELFAAQEWVVRDQRVTRWEREITFENSFSERVLFVVTHCPARYDYAGW